jgi:hypothetical protein
MNLNRSYIARTSPNPAVGRNVKTVKMNEKASAKKTKKISFEHLQHHDNQIVDINWGSIGQTFLNVTKDVAKFVITVLPSARYKYWHQEPAPDVATHVSTGMPYLVDKDHNSPFTIVRGVDQSILDFVIIHTTYSVPTDPNQQQIQ